MDFTDVIDAVDATAVVAGILAIGAVVMLPRVAAFGVRWLKRMVA